MLSKMKMPKLYDFQLKDGKSTLAGVNCSVHYACYRFIFQGEQNNHKNRSNRNAQIWINKCSTEQLYQKINTGNSKIIGSIIAFIVKEQHYLGCTGKLKEFKLWKMKY